MNVTVTLSVTVDGRDLGVSGGIVWHLADETRHDPGGNPRFIGEEVSRQAELAVSRVREQVDTRFGTTAEVS